MKGAGCTFERQVLASLPKWDRLWARKVPDPPTRPFRCRCGGSVAPKCDRCGSAQGHPATFTRPNPWDIEIRWFTMRRFHDPISKFEIVTQRWNLLIECKSTAGAVLPFSSVKEHQRGALANAAQAGSLAGVLWECRYSVRTCVYIPISTWILLEDTIGRKSLPIAKALVEGVRVEIDPGRGRTHTYYRLDNLLRSLAGENVEREPKQTLLEMTG